MVLKVLDQAFSICQVSDFSSIDLTGEYVFIGKTDEEFSLVCESSRTPHGVLAREDGWRAFRIEGTLDFSLIGILAKISSLLADAGIGIFVVSTFNTDYVLTKTEQFDKALKVLKANGYIIE